MLEGFLKPWGQYLRTEGLLCWLHRTSVRETGAFLVLTQKNVDGKLEGADPTQEGKDNAKDESQPLRENLRWKRCNWYKGDGNETARVAWGE